MSNEIIFKYLPNKNLKGRALTGVPLSDLTQAQFDAMPRWIQKSVSGCEFYQAVDAKPAPKAKAGKTAVVETVTKETED